MRLALAEASEGKLGTAGDKLLLFCFHYDPVSRSYVPFARNLMKAAGAMMVLVMGAILTLLWRRDRRRNAAALPDATALKDGVATAK
jgi:protein SCO1/2